MLLLVTIVLVLVAAVTLLIGIFSDNLALIFISIGASAAAAIVLAVLSQVSRRKGAAAPASTAPEPLPARSASTVADEQAEEAATTIEEIGEPVVRTVGASTPTAVVTIPIANYDALRVNEILPALQGLDLDELEAVAQHEEAGKNRATVLNRIDALMDELEAQEAAGTGTTTTVDEAAAESIATVGEPVVAPPSGAFPIPNYDELGEAELIPMLDDLDADQLEVVADREEAGQNRDAVLDAIDDRLDVLEGIVPAPPVAATAAPSRPAAGKKVPAKKVAAKKVPAGGAKKAATAKKSVAAPAAVKKAATSAKRSAAAAAPAKRTTTAKKAAKKAAAPVRKAPATAAGTKRAGAPAKKATAATKKTAKKSTKR